MAHLVITNRNGRRYASVQESFRNEKGEPRKRVIQWLGPLDPKRKRGVSLAPLAFLPVYAVGYGLRKVVEPGYKSKGAAKHKEQSPGHRERQEGLIRQAEVDRFHGVSMSNEQAYHASLQRMSQEERNAWMQDRLSSGRTHAPQTAKSEIVQAMQDCITAPPAPEKEDAKDVSPGASPDAQGQPSEQSPDDGEATAS